MPVNLTAFTFILASAPNSNCMTNNMSPICNARHSAIALNFKNRIVMRIWFVHLLFCSAGMDVS